MSEILKKLREKLIKEDNEAVLVSSEENQRYVSGFHYSDGYILITREKAYLLADFRYIEAARNEVCADDFEIACAPWLCMPGARLSCGASA